jgi:hypothetical protein
MTTLLKPPMIEILKCNYALRTNNICEPENDSGQPTILVPCELFRRDACQIFRSNALHKILSRRNEAHERHVAMQKAESKARSIQ